MARQHVLWIGGSEDSANHLPAPYGSDQYQVTVAEDTISGVAQAVAVIPDVVVISIPGNPRRAVDVCRQIAEYLPGERCPLLVVDPGRGPTSQESAAEPRRHAMANPAWPSAGMYGAAKHENGKDSATTSVPADHIRCHGLELDRLRFHGFIDGHRLTLTATEFNILWTLVSAPGHVKSRDELIDTCRGPDADIGRRTVDQHVRALRRKLGTRGELIETVRGFGYRFRDCDTGCMQAANNVDDDTLRAG